MHTHNRELAYEPRSDCIAFAPGEFQTGDDKPELSKLCSRFLQYFPGIELITGLKRRGVVRGTTDQVRYTYRVGKCGIKLCAVVL